MKIERGQQITQRLADGETGISKTFRFQFEADMGASAKNILLISSC
ncbi:MAG: hypothetical protein ABJK06_15915 [Parasphingorhabdus sp.]